MMKKIEDLKHGKNFYKHGMNGTKLYHVWEKMKARINNKNHINYSNYGGRGISICKEWDNDFTTFYDWAMENGYNEDLYIDRIDNDGNYEPNNCRFVTFTENVRNRSNTLFVEHNKVTKPLAEWAEILNLEYKQLYHQVRKRGKTIQEVIDNGI